MGRRSMRLRAGDCAVAAVYIALLAVSLATVVRAAVFPTGSFGFSSVIYSAEIDSAQLEFEDDDDLDGIFDDDDDDDGFRSDNTGSAVCQVFLNSDPPVLTCDVAHSSGTATTVEVWTGRKRVREDLVGALILSASGAMPSYFRSSVALNDETVMRVLDGESFLLFQSPEFEQGEMRGQLLQTNRLYALLSSQNIVPSLPTTVNTRGIFLANYTRFADPNDFKSPPDETLSIQVDHNVFGNPEAGQLFRGQIGRQSTLVLATVENPRTQIRQQINITETIARDIFSQQTFFQISSNSFGNGEIRGQLLPLDPIPPVTHTARMDHAQTVPPYSPEYGEMPRGCALVTIDCSRLFIEYLVVHNVEDAVRASASAAARGVTGVPLFDLARPASPIYGSRLISAAERSALFSWQLYFEVYKAGYDLPVLRGQVEADNDYFAYLSGTQMVPPVTTSAVGCASFDLRPDRVVDYDISHTVRKPSAVALYAGKIGEHKDVGLVDALFPTYQSPLHGSDVRLSSTDRNSFRTERMYLVVQSADYPNGELRGQVLRLLEAVCDPSGGDRAPSQFLPPDIPASQQFGIDSMVPEYYYANMQTRAAAAALAPHVLLSVALALAAIAAMA